MPKDMLYIRKHSYLLLQAWLTPDLHSDASVAVDSDFLKKQYINMDSVMPDIIILP